MIQISIEEINSKKKNLADFLDQRCTNFKVLLSEGKLGPSSVFIVLFSNDRVLQGKYQPRPYFNLQTTLPVVWNIQRLQDWLNTEIKNSLRQEG